MEILLKNCSYILTQDNDRSILKNQDILIKDGKIQDIGQNLSNSGYVIDCKNKLAMPGLVNTHNHLAMTLFKGYGDDMPLDKWLSEKIWPAEEKLDADAVYNGTMLAFAEMIKTGTTTFNDMYFFCEKVVDAAITAGMRGFASYSMIDLNNPEKRISEIKAAESFISYLKSKDTQLVKTMVAPHAPYTCSRELLEESKKLAQKYDLKIHIHVAETMKEVNDTIKEKNMRPVEYLDHIGLLSPEVIMAHSCHLSKEEISLAAKRGVKVSHNPTSNMKLATGGTLSLPVYLDAGISIGLGTDGSASNNSLDMFTEIKVCALLHKFSNNSPEVASAQQVFDMATRGGAKVLGLDKEIGSIEAGKQADIVLVNLKDISMIPNHNPVSNIVYSANGSCVDTTIVNGRILMENRILKTIDEEKVTDKVNEFASTLV
ncbi:amidohydrolase family protein [archaeon]|nr:amidohydrolase family protein [archaeon]